MRGIVHTSLKLQHHRHTAKRLHHQHTSYRALFILLALTAVCIGTIQRVSADTYVVTATVPSAILDQPAHVTGPLDGAQVSTSQATIHGTCQVVNEGTVVVLERDGQTIGSQICQTDGTFSIDVQLLPGENVIIPKVYTAILATPGPIGAELHITYVVPVVTQPETPPSSAEPEPAVSSDPTQSPITALAVKANVGFVQYMGKEASMTLHFEGGTVPYVVTIDWGDSSPVTTQTIDQSGDVTFTHSYETRNAYSIHVTLQDASGAVTSIQLAAIGSLNETATVVSSISPTGFINNLTDNLTPVAKAAWGVYFTTTFITVGFWATGSAPTFFPQFALRLRHLFFRRGL